MEEKSIISPSIETDHERVKKVNITEDDKERFLKCILTDQPYEELVSLFDDQLLVKFKAMTVQENSDVVMQVVADKANGIAGDTDAYFITLASYRLGLCIVSINDKPFSDIKKNNYTPKDADDTYVIARSKLFLGWSTYKLSVFLDAFQKFEHKVLELTKEVQTQNFWKASA